MERKHLHYHQVWPTSYHITHRMNDQSAYDAVAKMLAGVTGMSEDICKQRFQSTNGLYDFTVDQLKSMLTTLRQRYPREQKYLSSKGNKGDLVARLKNILDSDIIATNYHSPTSSTASSSGGSSSSSSSSSTLQQQPPAAASAREVICIDDSSDDESEPDYDSSGGGCGGSARSSGSESSGFMKAIQASLLESAGAKPPPTTSQAAAATTAVTGQPLRMALGDGVGSSSSSSTSGSGGGGSYHMMQSQPKNTPPTLQQAHPNFAQARPTTAPTTTHNQPHMPHPHHPYMAHNMMMPIPLSSSLGIPSYQHQYYNQFHLKRDASGELQHHQKKRKVR